LNNRTATAATAEFRDAVPFQLDIGVQPYRQSLRDSKLWMNFRGWFALEMSIMPLQLSSFAAHDGSGALRVAFDFQIGAESDSIPAKSSVNSVSF
jgi:hypothetical protein